MSGYIGDFRLGDTFDTKFTTVNTSGAPTTLTGSAAVSAYVGNSVTESTTGITLTVDFDSRTGLNNVRVVATGGNGYATASDYQLVITAGTVGGTSVVGYVIGEFSIEHRSALMPTTAARTLDVSSGGEAGLDWANIGSKTTVNDLSSTTISTSQAIASVSGSVGSVTGLTASNLDATVSSRLAPTTAGRTLDVTATGAAGIDWGNVENQTTVVGLSSTTISTSQAVASVSGAVGSVTGNVGGNVVGSVGSVTGLTASNLDATITSRLAPTTAGRTLDVTATGAAGIDWGNVENPTTVVGLSSTTISTSQAIASVSGAVGSVTGNVGGNVIGSVGSVSGAVGSVAGNVGGNVVGSVASVVATVSANVTQVNSITIDGAGTAGDPWGPV